MLALLSAGLLVGGTKTLLSWRRQRTYPDILKGTPDPSDFSHDVLRDVAWFTAALFGISPNQNDEDELIWRLDYLVKDDNAWRPRLTWLASYLQSQGDYPAVGQFNTLKDGRREDIAVDVVARESYVMGRRNGLLSLVSDNAMEERIFFRATYRQLGRIYIHSGVQWRRRGYSSWPGIPGDPREYTHPGSERSC
ncbi:MAG: hypothetical protein H6994_09850 [Pseudomonadales bacterium]|nr:hypothetical protein [Pseudomonadales bacterium]